MRKLRLLSLATVLAFSVAAPAFAGITDTPPAPAPEPSPQQAGITECPPIAETTDPVVTIALDVLQTVLSAF